MQNTVDMHDPFGGGAGQSAMNPLVLGVILLAAVAVLLLPRRYSVAAILVPPFLTPVGEQLLVGGFHFYGIRVVVLAGLVRLVTSSSKIVSNPLDRIVYVWAVCRAVTFVCLYKEVGAVVAQAAFCLDTCGQYAVLRFAIQDRADAVRAMKVLTALAALLAVCMSYEHLTRINVFSYLGSHTIIPWIRGDKVRAQGTFANSITAGIFGATLLPLFFWLWKSTSEKRWGLVGLAASALIVFTSVASTPLSASIGGCLAACLWPMRRQMWLVRWAVVIVVTTLALVMKAPVWYLLSRIDLVGGHGWDRAYLVDQYVRHIRDWWLLGSKDYSSWGAYTWDACNQFVAEGVSGGLFSLICFVAILSLAFSLLGKARLRTERQPDELLFWCLGAALFSHVIAFLGVDYFDQSRTLWFAFLAIVSAATIVLPHSENNPQYTPVSSAGTAWFSDDSASPDVSVDVPAWSETNTRAVAQPLPTLQH